MVITRQIKKFTTLVLILSALAIPLKAKASLFDSIKNYFNAPTKNALIATTAACVGLLSTTAYYFWKSWKNEKELERSGNYYNQYRNYERYLTDAHLEIQRLKSVHANSMRNFDECTVAYQSAYTAKERMKN
jgi:hypothetical protein